MKRNVYQIISSLVFVLFIISTIVTFLIVYKNIDGRFAFIYVVGYLIFLFLLCIYYIVMIIRNSIGLKRSEIGKRLGKFFMAFVLLGALNYLFDYIFRPSDIDYFREFSTSFGVSLGIVFWDVAFKSKKA